MAIRVENNESGALEARNTFAKTAEKSCPESKVQEGSLFAQMVGHFKPASGKPTASQPAPSSQFERPATSQITKHGSGKIKHDNAAAGRHRQGTNNLATSALIQLAALSPGGGKMGGVMPRVSGMTATGAGPGALPGLPDMGALQSLDASSGAGIGNLSAKFEAGDKGPATIGYDPQGGTSYGTYQIASRPGTMKLFVDYLQDRAPEWASKLRAAGPTNTGSRRGRMPEAWRQISAEDPERFAKIQADFIEETHYRPALEEISSKTGVDVSQQPKAIQEVLWSTAVQHGAKAAANIFCRALSKPAKQAVNASLDTLIRNVYNLRAGQFGSSTPQMRTALRNRFSEEKSMAIAMLSRQSSGSSNV
jgi:hypothetical protein